LERALRPRWPRTRCTTAHAGERHMAAAMALRVVVAVALAGVCLAKPPADSRAARRLQGSAQMAGGEPPAVVERELCDISSVFSHLMAIQTNPSCRAGCAGGSGICPDQWYPSGSCVAPVATSRSQSLPVVDAHTRHVAFCGPVCMPTAIVAVLIVALFLSPL
jgi:hypothetical protein